MVGMAITPRALVQGFEVGAKSALGIGAACACVGFVLGIMTLTGMGFIGLSVLGELPWWITIVVLVREVGVNSYKRVDPLPKDGDTYWNATKDFWSHIRKDWDALEAKGPFGLTVQGEPEPLYVPILTLADDIQAGKITTEAAVVEAKKVMAEFTTTNIGTLADRIAKATTNAQGYSEPQAASK